MPARPLSFALLVLAAGCAPKAPPPVVIADPVPIVRPDPHTLPPVELGPRRSWQRIAITPRSGISAAYAASTVATDPSGLRRRWILANLTQPIRLPETGGYARSAAALADFHCENHSWLPIETVWYAKPNAVREVLRDTPRQQAPEQIGQGTFVDVFLDAACKGLAHPHPQPTAAAPQVLDGSGPLTSNPRQ
jgi:hypothetical protein